MWGLRIEYLANVETLIGVGWFGSKSCYRPSKNEVQSEISLSKLGYIYTYMRAQTQTVYKGACFVFCGEWGERG